MQKRTPVKRIIMNCFLKGSTHKTAYTLNTQTFSVTEEKEGEGNPISCNLGGSISPFRYQY